MRRSTRTFEPVVPTPAAAPNAPVPADRSRQIQRVSRARAGSARASGRAPRCRGRRRRPAPLNPAPLRDDDASRIRSSSIASAATSSVRSAGRRRMRSRRPVAARSASRRSTCFRPPRRHGSPPCRRRRHQPASGNRMRSSISAATWSCAATRAMPHCSRSRRYRLLKRVSATRTSRREHATSTPSSRVDIAAAAAERERASRTASRKRRDRYTGGDHHEAVRRYRQREGDRSARRARHPRRRDDQPVAARQGRRRLPADPQADLRHREGPGQRRGGRRPTPPAWCARGATSPRSTSTSSSRCRSRRTACKACKTLSSEGHARQRHADLLRRRRRGWPPRSARATSAPSSAVSTTSATTGMNLVREIVDIFDNYEYPTEVLVASVRNPIHVVEAARMGADVVTVPAGGHRAVLQASAHRHRPREVPEGLGEGAGAPKSSGCDR